MASEDDIRPVGKRALVQAISIAERMERVPCLQFRLGVACPDSGHHPAACQGIDNICHLGMVILQLADRASRTNAVSGVKQYLSSEDSSTPRFEGMTKQLRTLREFLASKRLPVESRCHISAKVWLQALKLAV